MSTHKGKWRRSYEIVFGVGMSLLFLYWAGSSSGAWTWLLVAAAVVSMLLTFGDMRGLADELDDRGSHGEYSPAYQREYQRLWSESRAREEELTEALEGTNDWIFELIENGLGYEHTEAALARIQSNKEAL